MRPSGNEQKSNVTDPESAKMATSRGTIQGYNGLAVVDDRSQIVVHAEAHGSGYEGHLLAPLLEATRATFGAMEPGNDVLKKAKVTADAGFHSRVVVAQVEASRLGAAEAHRGNRRSQDSASFRRGEALRRCGWAGRAREPSYSTSSLCGRTRRITAARRSAVQLPKQASRTRALTMVVLSPKKLSCGLPRWG